MYIPRKGGRPLKRPCGSAKALLTELFAMGTAVRAWAYAIVFMEYLGKIQAVVKACGTGNCCDWKLCIFEQA